MAADKKVRDIMMGQVKTMPETKSVLDAAQAMAKHKIGAIICLDHEKHTVGIFTERDLLNKVVALELPLSTPLSQVMTKDLVCAQLHDSMDGIPDMMIKGGFRHVPVLDGFTPVGILSIRDVLKFVYKN